MKKLLCLLLFLSSTGFAQSQAYIYVSHPSTHWYDSYVSWDGKAPDCKEVTQHYGTFGWKYGLYEPAIHVSIKSRTTNATLCSIDIDEDLPGDFPRVKGDCYVIHSNNPRHGFDTSWITLNDAPPDRSSACQ